MRFFFSAFWIVRKVEGLWAMGYGRGCFGVSHIKRGYSGVIIIVKT